VKTLVLQLCANFRLSLLADLEFLKTVRFVPEAHIERKIPLS